jgi:hypothetical protein
MGSPSHAPSTKRDVRNTFRTLGQQSRNTTPGIIWDTMGQYGRQWNQTGSITCSKHIRGLKNECFLAVFTGLPKLRAMVKKVFFNFSPAVKGRLFFQNGTVDEMLILGISPSMAQHGSLTRHNRQKNKKRGRSHALCKSLLQTVRFRETAHRLPPYRHRQHGCT